MHVLFKIRIKISIIIRIFCAQHFNVLSIPLQRDSLSLATYRRHSPDVKFSGFVSHGNREKFYLKWVHSFYPKLVLFVSFTKERVNHKLCKIWSLLPLGDTSIQAPPESCEKGSSLGVEPCSRNEKIRLRYNFYKRDCNRKLEYFLNCVAFCFLKV